jgi:hypothetical protein
MRQLLVRDYRLDPLPLDPRDDPPRLRPPVRDDPLRPEDPLMKRPVDDRRRRVDDPLRPESLSDLPRPLLPCFLPVFAIVTSLIHFRSGMRLAHSDQYELLQSACSTPTAPEKGREVLLLGTRQAQAEDEIEELHRVFEGEGAAVVQVGGESLMPLSEGLMGPSPGSGVNRSSLRS